jgi:hypothetical protein
MNNETGLDWMARNVHVWPDGMREVLVCYPRNVDALIWSCVSSNAGWINKEQWLARRAELQNKPSWDLSGSWSKYLAQDMDGEWKWLGENPSLGDEYWTADELRSQCKGVVIGDWRDTLEKRPVDLSEQAVTERLQEATANVLAAAPELMKDKFKFEPFVSVEDNQGQKMKQDNGWFERGELPPVGARCVALLGIAPKANCEVIAKTERQMVVKWEENGLMDVIDLDVHVAFRPIPTERDVLLSIIVEEMNRYDTDDKLADAILAAGFKRGAA